MKYNLYYLKMQFIDLKFCSHKCHSPASHLQEPTSYEFRENHFLPTDELYPVLRISPMRRAIQRQLQSKKFSMLESISLHGLRPIDLPGKSAGHTGLSSRQPAQTLSHGHTRKGVTKHPGTCQPDAGLENLRRLRSGPDQKSKTALLQRTIWRRAESHGVCPGFNHHRPVPVSVSLGHLPQEKRSRQAAYLS